MSNARLPKTSKSLSHPVEVAIHRPWGLSKSYHQTSMEAYEVADRLLEEGYAVSIVV